jgi:hypothetical protein
MGDPLDDEIEDAIDDFLDRKHVQHGFLGEWKMLNPPLGIDYSIEPEEGKYSIEIQNDDEKPIGNVLFNVKVNRRFNPHQYGSYRYHILPRKFVKNRLYS